MRLPRKVLSAPIILVIALILSIAILLMRQIYTEVNTADSKPKNSSESEGLSPGFYLNNTEDYKSQKWGIIFTHIGSRYPDKKQKVIVTELDNKIFIHESGQTINQTTTADQVLAYIEVIPKSETDSLEVAVQKKFLKSDAKNCIFKSTTVINGKGIEGQIIPANSISDHTTIEELNTLNKLCPKWYTTEVSSDTLSALKGFKLLSNNDKYYIFWLNNADPYFSTIGMNNPNIPIYWWDTLRAANE